MIYFEWDKNKDISNKNKHGINFTTAIHIFNDPYILSWLDGRYDYGEERWISLGAIENEIIVIVTYVLKGDEDEEEIIRIISARKANKKESAHYFRFYRKK